MNCTFGISTSNVTDKSQHWIKVNKHLQTNSFIPKSSSLSFTGTHTHSTSMCGLQSPSAPSGGAPASCRRCGCSHLVGPHAAPCSWWGITHKLRCTPWGVGLCLQQPAWKQAAHGIWLGGCPIWLMIIFVFKVADKVKTFLPFKHDQFGEAPCGFMYFFTHAHHKWFSHIPVLKGGVTQTICQHRAVRSSCVPRSHSAISSILMLHGQGIEAHPPSRPLRTARLLNAVLMWLDYFVFLTFWSFS